MGRLARRLFTLCSAVSLLLCVGVCVLWVRNYSRLTTVVLLHAESRLYAVSVARGGVYLIRVHGSPDALPQRLIDVPMRGARNDLTLTHRFAGFGYDPPSHDVEVVLVPLWFVTVSLLAVPLLIGWRRLRRARDGHDRRCATCGYDLRATPGRCPECGTSSAAASRGV